MKMDPAKSEMSMSPAKSEMSTNPAKSEMSMSPAKSEILSVQFDGATFDALTPGTVFVSKKGKKYKVIKSIGQGGMSAVYLGKEKGSISLCAIKVEKYAQNHHKILQRQGLHIAMEKLTLKALGLSPFFPNFLDSGRTALFGWIAMELVGPNLYELWMNTEYQKLSEATVLNIAIQVVVGLRDLHSKGFVHRDLKPDNLAIGRGVKKDQIYILDTGIARQYKTVQGVPLKPRVKVRVQGSLDYSCLTMQRGQESGPKDDFEALYYILSAFLVGNLPWSSIKSSVDIVLSKFDCVSKPSLLFEKTGALCPVLTELWNYNVGLHYADEVDYDYITRTLLAVQVKLNCVNQLFDWDPKKV